MRNTILLATVVVALASTAAVAAARPESHHTASSVAAQLARARAALGLPLEQPGRSDGGDHGPLILHRACNRFKN